MFIDDRKKTVNISGKTPWTASAEPVRAPRVGADAREGDGGEHRVEHEHQRAADAALDVDAGEDPDR